MGPRLSPDGKRAVTLIREKGFVDIWMYDIGRGTLTRLTFESGDNVNPIFSPDGQRIAFSRLKDGNFSILAKSADGSGSEETLLPPQSVRSNPSSWSPDGKFLAHAHFDHNGKREIWVLPLEGERKPQPLLANQFGNRGAWFSPDGKYLAYVSNENGRDEVYVMPFRNGSAKWQISTNGTSGGPIWQRDGKQLFYPESGNIIMGVDIATQPTFHASTPRVIVPAKAMGNLGGYDVSPDGQRFLISRQSNEGAQTAQINVILNWSEELRRRSSGKN